MSANNELINWLERKAALESFCKRKGWVWEKTLEEHHELAQIDAKLLQSGYYESK